MAEGRNIDVHDISESKKYFCHQCTSEIEPELPDFVCSQCHGGFIEELTESAIAELQARSSRRPGAESRSSRSSDDEHPVSRQVMFSLFNDRQRARENPRESHDRALPLHSFIDSILVALRENPAAEVRSGGEGIQWTVSTGRRRGGVSQVYQRLAADIGNLDDIITRLVSQLSTSGPEPASKTQIDSLPITPVDAQVVADKVQCSICMDAYDLGDLVSTLPCHHLYHNTCIAQWLQLHATCPVCRQTLASDDGSAASGVSTSSLRRPGPASSRPVEEVVTIISDDEDDDDDNVVVATSSVDYANNDDERMDHQQLDDDDDNDSIIVVNVNDDEEFERAQQQRHQRFQLFLGNDDDDDDDVEMMADAAAAAQPPSSSLQPIYVDDIEVDNDL